MALTLGPRSTPLPCPVWGCKYEGHSTWLPPGQEESQLLKLVLTGALRQNPPPRPEEAPSPELHLPPPTKTNLRRIKGPDVEHSIIKPLEENRERKKLHDTGMDNNLLRYDSKGMGIKRKNGQPGFLENFHLSKDTISRVKRQPQNVRKYW